MASVSCRPLGVCLSFDSLATRDPHSKHAILSRAPPLLLPNNHACQNSAKSSLLSRGKHSKCLAIAVYRGAKLEVFASLSGVTDDDFSGCSDLNNDNLAFCTVNSTAPVMKRGYGAFGGATLEKSKLDLSQSTTRVSPQTEDGGGGGDIGNKIFHGGGDGGDDGGDDDDYFGDEDDEDEGDEGGFFRRRVAFPEVFDRKIVEAILQEWYRTITDLPAGLRQAMEMGLISSVQMVRFMAMNARPTLARLISRSVPASVSRAFIGRMLADPGFLHKMILEQAVTVGHGVWWEVKYRRERLKDEWDLAIMNILTLSICNAAMVWSLAPCRSYGSTSRFNLQNTIQKLPNNIFERSYPLREFNLAKRVQGFFYKAGELCLFGMLAGAAGGSMSKLAVAFKKEDLSVPIPSITTSALSYGAFLGLSGNIRYQLLYGAEQGMQQYFDNFGFVVICSTALRLLNIYIGDVSRRAWLGLESPQMLETLSVYSAYRRPSLMTENPLNGWSIPRNISSIFSFGFLARKEDTAVKRSENKMPQRRKVKRRVMAAS